MSQLENKYKCKFLKQSECELFCKNNSEPHYGNCIFSTVKFHVCRYSETINMIKIFNIVADVSEDAYHDCMCQNINYTEEK